MRKLVVAAAAVALAALSLTGCIQTRSTEYFAGYVAALNQQMIVFHSINQETCSSISLAQDDLSNFDRCNELYFDTDSAIYTAKMYLTKLDKHQMNSDIKPLYNATMRDIDAAVAARKGTENPCNNALADMGTTPSASLDLIESKCWTARANQRVAFENLYQTTQRWEPYL